MHHVSIGLVLCVAALALGCGQLRVDSERNALEAARVEWLRKGVATDACSPQLKVLTKSGYEASCGSQVTYVRCWFSDGLICCTTMKDREAAVEFAHTERLNDVPASQVCN